MVEPSRDGISARVRKLPGQFLLALINATTILVIVAAILVLLAIVRIEHFAESIVATMTEAVLSKVDLPSREVLANVRNLAGEVRALGETLKEIKERDHPILQSEIARLKDALTVLKGSIDRIGSARSMLTDEALARLGTTITGALITLKDCAPEVGPNGASARPESQAQRVRLMDLNFRQEVAAN